MIGPVRCLLIACLSTMAWAGAAQANTEFALRNCERQEQACTQKCQPVVKVVPGKSGEFENKLDGRKVPSCRSKCIQAANKCEAKANASAAASCTTSAQCGPEAGCFDGRCVKR